MSSIKKAFRVHYLWNLARHSSAQLSYSFTRLNCNGKDFNDRVIPYQPKDLSEPADLVAAIRTRRGGELINLDRMLLHSIPLSRGWNNFLGEVRNNLSIELKMRELIMCVVAVLNGASYELEHHAPIFIRSGGTGDQLAAIKGLAGITSESSSARHQLPPGLFSALELAVVELAIQMTLRVKVEATLIAELRELLAGSDAAVVELVGVVAAYNMVSRFLVALDVTPDQH